MNDFIDAVYLDKTVHFQQELNRQDKIICALKKKLKSYKDVVAEADYLRELCHEHDQWNKKNKYEHDKVFSELYGMLKIQIEKVKTFVTKECQWKVNYKKLQHNYDCIAAQLQNLKSSEIQLKSKLVELEINKNCVQRELCENQLLLEKKNCEVEEVKANLKCAQDELFKVRTRLDKCTTELSQLNETRKKLELELESRKSNLTDEISKACGSVETVKLERDALSNELKTKCKQLSDIETKYEDAKCKINDDTRKINLLTTTLKELIEGSKKSHCEMKNQIEKLKENNRAKEDDLFHLKTKANELIRANEFYTTKLNVQKNQLYDKECQLKQFKLLSERIHPENNDCCQSEMNTKKQSANINNCAEPMNFTPDTNHCLSNCQKLNIKKCTSPSVTDNNCFTTTLKNVQFELANLKNDISQLLTH